MSLSLSSRQYFSLYQYFLKCLLQLKVLFIYLFFWPSYLSSSKTIVGYVSSNNNILRWCKGSDDLIKTRLIRYTKVWRHLDRVRGGRYILYVREKQTDLLWVSGKFWIAPTIISRNRKDLKKRTEFVLTHECMICNVK